MKHIRRFDLLIALYIFCIAAAELMGSKTFLIPFINLPSTVAIFLIPLLFTISDVIVEVHGKERARSIIFCGLIVVFLILLLSLFFTALPPSGRFEKFEPAYDTIFGKSARIAAASLTAFAIAAFLDVLVFTKIRRALGEKSLWLRNNLSNFIAQFFDTVIFMSLAFYEFNDPLFMNVSFLVTLILPYWLLKCFMSIIETPLVYLGVNWLKKDKEKL